MVSLRSLSSPPSSVLTLSPMRRILLIFILLLWSNASVLALTPLHENTNPVPDATVLDSTKEEKLSSEGNKDIEVSKRGGIIIYPYSLVFY